MLIDYTSTKKIDDRMTGPGCLNNKLDVREEMHLLLHEEKRAIPIVYRRVRRDANRLPIISPDRLDSRSGTPSLDVPSRDGDDIGYLFDDYIMYCFMPGDISESSAVKAIAAGQTKNEAKDIFLEYNCLSRYTKSNLDLPDEKDIVIFPVMDLEGKLVSPLKIAEICKIKTVEDFRLENNGRVEYFRLSLTCKEKKNFIL